MRNVLEYMWETEGGQETPSLGFQKRLPGEKVGLSRQTVRNRECEQGKSVTMAKVR